ncbi:YbjQ family protein [Salipiger marinus]|uniref:YbjQ family protein n=1 Tax=Salipiger marinus TaxID=555512 RepID=UPI00405874FB
MPECQSCGKERVRFLLVEGSCFQCREDARAAEARLQLDEQEAKEAEERAAIETATARIILTTESAHHLPVDRYLDIVTAEVVIGMHLFKDIAGAFRDAFGGRSQTMQHGLRDARKAALKELRLEALALGADAVVGVDLDYSEISGGGKSMLFLVASGTAVTLSGSSDFGS